MGIHASGPQEEMISWEYFIMFRTNLKMKRLNVNVFHLHNFLVFI